MSAPPSAFMIGPISPLERQLVLLYRDLSPKRQDDLIGWAAYQVVEEAKTRVREKLKAARPVSHTAGGAR